MSLNEIYNLIESNPDLRGGKPVIKGTRIAVEDILGYLAGGDTFETLVEQFPELDNKKIRAAIGYAGNYVGETTLISLSDHFQVPSIMTVNRNLQETFA